MYFRTYKLLYFSQGFAYGNVFSGEVGKRQVPSGCCVPNIIKIG